VPHFLAIAWMYREDYDRAGMKMLPVIDTAGTATSRQMLLYMLALIPISLGPALLGLAGAMYVFAAAGLGLYFLRAVWGFITEPSVASARKVLHASLFYLPGVLGALLLDFWVRYLLTLAA
jgi:protoheme IX farnesyltransferase